MPTTTSEDKMEPKPKAEMLIKVDGNFRLEIYFASNDAAEIVRSKMQSSKFGKYFIADEIQPYDQLYISPLYDILEVAAYIQSLVQDTDSE